MNDDQIRIIQNYQGDTIEEYWKPGSLRSNRSYVDLFNFWELRQKFRAYGLEHLRPATNAQDAREQTQRQSQNDTRAHSSNAVPSLNSEDSHPTLDQCISRKAIFRHERLASYSYSAYCRTASLHQCISDLEEQIRKDGPLLLFHVLNSFESFYLFLGSALDNSGGVGNIMLGYANSEDSFSDFVKSFRVDDVRTTAYPDALRVFDAARNINENYRAQIAHRGRLATLMGERAGFVFPYALAEFEKTGPATESISWRKDIREMVEGRKKILPMTQLCYYHLRTIEQAIDEVFRISFGEINSYLQRNGIKLAEDSSRFEFVANPLPENARWILYRCNHENRPYLNIWFHDLSKGDLPTMCINKDCKSEEITPMYYIKE